MNVTISAGLSTGDEAGLEGWIAAMVG